MSWKSLESIGQIDQIIEDSKSKPVAIFKHSTSCGISRMVYKNFNRELESKAELNADLYYLDLLKYRPISNLVAEKFSVRHESPQLIIIQNGIAIHDSSHHSIDPSVVE